MQYIQRKHGCTEIIDHVSEQSGYGKKNRFVVDRAYIGVFQCLLYG